MIKKMPNFKSNHFLCIYFDCTWTKIHSRIKQLKNQTPTKFEPSRHEVFRVENLLYSKDYTDENLIYKASPFS